MPNPSVPIPMVMPVDSSVWKNALNFSNFVNSYYQYRDLQSCVNAKKVLIIGPGQGLDTQIFKWRGYEITTFDIDSSLSPDVVGSVHDLSVFGDSSFDVVIASHVLEHLPVPYLDQCLSEIARIGEYSLVYLPVAGRHFQFRIGMDIKGFTLSYIFDLFNYFHKPDGITARYCSGQHFWELGMRGYRVTDMLSRFERYFKIVSHYRNRDWNPSYNFVLQRKKI